MNDTPIQSRTSADGLDTLEAESPDTELLMHPDGDDPPPLDLGVLATWLRRWRCPGVIINVLILGLLRDVQRTIELDSGLLGKLCLLFSIFSARLLITPLWTMPFVPGLSPIYEHGPVS